MKRKDFIKDEIRDRSFKCFDIAWFLQCRVVFNTHTESEILIIVAAAAPPPFFLDKIVCFICYLWNDWVHGVLVSRWYVYCNISFINVELFSGSRHVLSKDSQI